MKIGGFLDIPERLDRHSVTKESNDEDVFFLRHR